MKKLFTILVLCFTSFIVSAQTYTPIIANYTISGKPIGYSQATPSDGRQMFYDASNFIYRPFQNPTEVLTYLNLPKYRAGNVIYVVDSGGVLNGNGTYSGAHNTFYMFRDGVADGNLVKMFLFGESTGGGGESGVTLVSATNGSGLSFTITNPTTIPNISIVTAAGGDASGPLNNLSVNKFNGLTPSFYLNYNNLSNLPTIPAQLNPSCSGCSITGTYPNLTWTVTGSGFNTAGYGLIALSSSVVAIDSQNYRKVDSLYGVNDSTLNYVLNGITHSIQIKGGVGGGGGGGSGTVTNFSFVNANGISGSVTNPTSIPALTLTLGAITPTSVNGLTLTALSVGFTIQGGTTSKTLTVPLDATVSGVNTGNVTLAGETYLTIAGQVVTVGAVNLSGTNATGTLAAARFGALTGDVTNSAGSYATTISNNVVTNAKLAQMPTLTIKGNNTGGTANALDLTVAQVNAMLPIFTSVLNGLVPAPTTVTGKVLSDNGTWIVNGTVVSIGTLDGQTPSSNGAVIASGSLFLQSASISNPGLVNNATQTFSGAKTFSTSLTISPFTSPGGALYTNGSGLVLQAVAGTSGTTLHGGTTPSFAFIEFATDLVGSTLLSENHGGTGNATYTVGDMLYATGVTSLAKLSDVAINNVLTSGGVNTAPLWGKVALGALATLPAQQLIGNPLGSSATPQGISLGFGLIFDGLNRLALDTANSNDTLFLRNLGGPTYDSLAYASGTTLWIRKILFSTGFTVTHNADSSLILTVTGGGGGTTDYQLQTASGSTSFTFTSVPASMNDYMIFRNGIFLLHTTDFTTAGNVVTIPSVVTGDKIVFQRIK